jgi:hypothetical protein
MARNRYARCTYFKKLPDGRFEYGFTEWKGDKEIEIPQGITAESIRAFWWCQIN